MQTATDTIKERIDIVEFISGYLSLRKSGKNFIGFCPFHANTKSAAFYVFPDTQSFHCFGCKASGTVFDFLMRREGLEFREALEQLATRAGVELTPRTAEQQGEDQQRTKLLEINQAAAAFFQHMLHTSPRGEVARAYVAKRKLDTPTVEAFQLGYAPEEWSALLAYLTDRKNYDPDDIAAAGLIIKRESGGYYDRFRNRLMFPIRNAKGEVIAFGGRAIGDAQPKYMNSPQTPLFDKSKVLYGLDLARDPIRAEDAVVIVEGYVDVMVAHQYGFKNVVAPLGTALTADHVGVLKKLGCTTLYLALDADAAGVRATLKGLNTVQENLDAHGRLLATAQGLVWTRELDAEIKILELPEGRDPDEVIQSDQELWRRLVAQAKPMMDFYLTALTADLDLESARGKSTAVSRLTPLLGKIPDVVAREHYITKIAALAQVEEFVIRATLKGDQKAQSVRPEQKRPVAQPAIGPTETPGHEDFLLGWLLRYPTARRAVAEKLRGDLALFPSLQALIAGSVIELLRGAENRVIWQAWERQPETSDLAAWADTLDEALRAQVMRVLLLNIVESQTYRYVNDALERATMLQLSLAREWKKRLSQQLDLADDAQGRTTEQLMQLLSYIDVLSTPKKSPTYNDLHTRTA